MNSIRFTPARLIVESVRDNLRRTYAALAEKQCARHGCFVSWQRREAMAKEEGVTGLEFTSADAKHRDNALASYDLDIAKLEKEVKLWEDALSLALDSLEVRA